jgi:hypothetical protein
MSKQAPHRHSLAPGSGRTKRSPQAGRAAAVVIAVLAAVGVMAGESWVLENAPATNVACAIGQASDLTRALDSGAAAVASSFDTAE